MRSWAIARLDILCGGCEPPTHLRKGAPMLEISTPAWTVVRCPDCAGEPVPDVIHGDPRTAPLMGAKLAVRLEQIRGLARDWKHDQAGDRR